MSGSTQQQPLRPEHVDRVHARERPAEQASSKARKAQEMYAVIKTGGKQYRVSEGDTLQVEKLVGKPGDKITFDNVLLVGGGDSTKVGAPTVSGAKVDAEIVAQNRAKKVVVFKMRRRKNYRRKQGHRQPYTQIKITSVTG